MFSARGPWSLGATIERFLAALAALRAELGTATVEA